MQKNTGGMRFSEKAFIVGLLVGSISITTGGIAAAAEMPIAPPSLSAGAQGHDPRANSNSEPSQVVLSGGDAGSSIGLPGKAAATQHLDASDVPEVLFAGQGAPIASTVLPSASLTSYVTSTGTQTLITIKSSAAASTYSFPLSLPANAIVNVESDGSVSVRDAEGIAMGKFLAPWAKDANGQNVETSLTVQDQVLIQSVKFDPTTAFPVVADPQWWQLALSITAGAATGAAVAAAFAGVSTGVGVIIGGCVTGALNSMWDGSTFWGGFRGCLLGAALGAVGRIAGSIVKNTLKGFGIGV
ncbi:hypothetical protein [Cryobacterium sp. PH31-L1]|uniref:hypothetical protein n=1 Tax=Cryobacterium sp. PH31-L1 TaxID=3046199 RepID=UPI0024B978E2|nr:hypothetical protein [Cryobacterium sp. PH31-L1]MDJ0376268.1 hypothetical protein [Cryobacterium sp. PH31-L1]